MRAVAHLMIMRTPFHHVVVDSNAFESTIHKRKFAVNHQALEKALDAVEQRQYQVVEALARAPRDELGDEDDDDDGSDASSSRGAAAEGGAQADAEMGDQGAPPPAAVASGSVIQRLMRALEGAGQGPRAAAPRDPPGAGGGLPVGGDGEEGVGTALSAFLEHLITKNSGATRNIQPVGLSGAVHCIQTHCSCRCIRQCTRQNNL